MWRELQPGDPEMIGPYRLRALLGIGGMGRVYLGVSAGGRPVAVKVIRADLASDNEFRTRFQREIAVARKVSGQFTAPVIDADLNGPVPWLVTAYVSGPSLADAVAEHGPLPERSVLELAAGLAEGLAAIHAAGVVHRDLKPANVLLAETSAGQPAPGWLPEPVTRTFLQLPAQLDASRTVTSLAPATAPQPIQVRQPESRPRRRGLGRPLVIASMVAGLLAAGIGGHADRDHDADRDSVGEHGSGRRDHGDRITCGCHRVRPQGAHVRLG